MGDNLSPINPRISLDVDDRQHGEIDANGIALGGPETTTFRSLLPGRYDVYVNVYEVCAIYYDSTEPCPASQRTSFGGDAWIEAYIGAGSPGSASMVDKVPLTAKNEVDNEGKPVRWFHVGYYVAHTDISRDGMFEWYHSHKDKQPSVAPRLQDKPEQDSPHPRIYLSWVRVGQLLPECTHGKSCKGIFRGPEDLGGGVTCEGDGCFGDEYANARRAAPAAAHVAGASESAGAARSGAPAGSFGAVSARRPRARARKGRLFPTTRTGIDVRGRRRAANSSHAALE